MKYAHVQKAVVEKLRRHGPMTSLELSRATDLPKSSVKIAANNLESKGVLRRAGTKIIRGHEAVLWEAVS